MYSDAEQREKMVEAERKFTDDAVRQVIALKKKVCEGNDKGFVVITQKGIDLGFRWICWRKRIF